PHLHTPTPFPYTTLFRSRSVNIHVRTASRDLFFPESQDVIIVPGTQHHIPEVAGVRFLQFDTQRNGYGVVRVTVTVNRLLLHHRSEEHTSELQSRENLVC